MSDPLSRRVPEWMRYHGTVAGNTLSEVLDNIEAICDGFFDVTPHEIYEINTEEITRTDGNVVSVLATFTAGPYRR